MSETEDTKDLPEFTEAEVARHCTFDDLWLIFDGKVYNMTSYYPKHPGGTAMLRRAGEDASVQIRLVNAHNLPWKFIQKTLGELCIGSLKKKF